MEKLTPKQQRFVDEYLVDLNATQAAIRVGYAHPTTQGPRLLENVGIKAAIVGAQAARSKRTNIDSDWVLSRLAVEAEADLAHIFDEHGALRPIADWPLIWRQGLVAGIEVQQNTFEGVQIGETVKIKLSDRIKRIELIGKHVNVQAFREQVHQTGSVTLNVTQEDAEL